MKKSIIITIFAMMVLLACQPAQQQVRPTEDSVVLLFEKYAPKSFTTRMGAHRPSRPAVIYADGKGNFMEENSQYQADTLTIPCPDDIVEVGIDYRHFEYAYFLLRKGDTLVVVLDSLEYPIVRSKYHAERDEAYNVHYQTRSNHTVEELEVGTILGDADFHRIAVAGLDFLQKNHLDRFALSYYPIDSLQVVFDDYLRTYTEVVDGYLQEGQISQREHELYLSHLKYKQEYARFNERDTTYYHQLESRFSDELLAYPSYQEFLDYYLTLFNQHIKYVRTSGGGYKNWAETFDGIAAKTLPMRTKHLLLKKCMEQLTEYFAPAKVAEYLAKYEKMTGDTMMFAQVKEHITLTADRSQLLLHDMQGNRTDFAVLQEKYRGKVLYVDFWASWCAPCRGQMPYAAELRQKFTDKDVVFVYLALNDKETDWQEESVKEGLGDLPTNFFIENSRNCEMLDELRVTSIPRYLIFDQEGNLVNADAPRPSSDDIIEELNKVIDKTSEDSYNSL